MPRASSKVSPHPQKKSFKTRLIVSSNSIFSCSRLPSSTREISSERSMSSLRSCQETATLDSPSATTAGISCWSSSAMNSVAFLVISSCCSCRLIALRSSSIRRGFLVASLRLFNSGRVIWSSSSRQSSLLSSHRSSYANLHHQQRYFRRTWSVRQWFPGVWRSVD